MIENKTFLIIAGTTALVALAGTTGYIVAQNQAPQSAPMAQEQMASPPAPQPSAPITYAPTQSQPTYSQAAPEANPEVVEIVTTTPPPALPVYVVPEPPAPNLIWTPGYWRWDRDDYVWIPGTWVNPPRPGLLWTPGYWVFASGRYGWHEGHWGERVGFYGGIHYGGGYDGHGFNGGEWSGHTYTPNRTVINTVNISVAAPSFNGPNGVAEHPMGEEHPNGGETHMPPTDIQLHHVEMSNRIPEQRTTTNHGTPPVMAMPRPAEYVPAAPQAEPERHDFQPGQRAPANQLETPHENEMHAPENRPENHIENVRPAPEAAPQLQHAPNVAPAVERATPPAAPNIPHENGQPNRAEPPHPEGRPAEAAPHEKPPEHHNDSNDDQHGQENHP